VLASLCLRDIAQIFPASMHAFALATLALSFTNQSHCHPVIYSFAILAAIITAWLQ